VPEDEVHKEQDTDQVCHEASRTDHQPIKREDAPEEGANGSLTRLVRAGALQGLGLGVGCGLRFQGSVPIVDGGGAAGLDFSFQGGKGVDEVRHHLRPHAKE